MGDYPTVPHIPSQLKNPYTKYFDQQERRNFGDPVPSNIRETVQFPLNKQKDAGTGRRAYSIRS